MTLSRINNILRIVHHAIWPPAPKFTEAAITYYQSVLEESK